jgi:16S rRNA C967 or C1407 C5-methylase (RsmB/RsmF family)/NOL1/NOP2/fmu family ribosome biogenesis protein
MRALLGAESEALELSLEASAPVSVRVNSRKLQQAGLAVDELFPAREAIPWCRDGYYLSERPSFTFDPLFHAGAYYVQEASSMFLEQALTTITAATGNISLDVLDLCAAPGGKATHLLSLLPQGSATVCNEAIRNRCAVLEENIAKWGNAGVIITNDDAATFGRFMSASFDLILADLPCSGEGMFRKDKTSRAEWTVENVRLCAARQRRIVRDVWNALRPGGYLVYCTCTFNSEENEDNVAALAQELGATTVALGGADANGCQYAVPSLNNRVTAYRFFPHRARGEGFFLALMHKDGELRQDENIAHNAETFSVVIRGRQYTLPASLRSMYNKVITSGVKTLTAGVFVGEQKGATLVPSVQFALSELFERAATNIAELSSQDAIRYLQREALSLPPETPKGFTAVSYKRLPLGFVKNIGSRANNLYPVEWRIRKRTS